MDPSTDGNGARGQGVTDIRRRWAELHSTPHVHDRGIRGAQQVRQPLGTIDQACTRAGAQAVITEPGSTLRPLPGRRRGPFSREVLFSTCLAARQSSRNTLPGILFWPVSATMLLPLRAQFARQRAGTRPMHAGGDMGPVARRCEAQVAAVQQVVGPVTLAAVHSVWGDGADRRVQPRGPPSSPSDSAVGWMVDLCPGLAA
jgi:hypothetical protein